MYFIFTSSSHLIINTFLQKVVLMLNLLQWALPAAFESLHLIQLLEPNIFGVLSEALTANVKPVFADHSVVVGAGAAKIK